ncbi:MAG: hypothetical protein KBT07_02370 [Clostridiales bacterium]|nr:hypothetical protein [Candidatus Scatonaster coprocaballi]
MKNRKWIALLLSLAMLGSICGCKKNSASKDNKLWKTSISEAAEPRDSSEGSATETTSASTSETTDETSGITSDTTSETTTVPEETTAPLPIPEGAKEPIHPDMGFGEGSQNSMTERLLELDGVVAAELLCYLNQGGIYYVIFKVPLDWEHPENGSFHLRTVLNLTSESNPTTFLCNGYMLGSMSAVNETAVMFGTNCIECEHRFFGSSVPEGLDIDSTELWQYLTVENAAHDFHFIIEQYKKILPQKWIFTGSSKGGQVTCYQSCYYPDDCDVYISYVAPGGGARQMTGFYEHMYTDIGNKVYGEEKGKYYRDLMLEFQVEALKLKEKYASLYYQQGLNEGTVFRDFATPEILYDVAVLEFATATWQYFRDFDAIERVLAMDRNSKEFKDAVFVLLCTANSPSSLSASSLIFPYFIQAATQNGENKMTFSYIRDALKAQGLEDLLTVTEDMEKDLLFKLVFTSEQLEQFTFHGEKNYQDLLNWSHTTKNTVIMIYGGEDVWYTDRLPDVTDNENVHTYVAEEYSHIAMIFNLTPDESSEIKQIVTEALQSD